MRALRTRSRDRCRWRSPRRPQILRVSRASTSYPLHSTPESSPGSFGDMKWRSFMRIFDEQMVQSSQGVRTMVDQSDRFAESLEHSQARQRSSFVRTLISLFTAYFGRCRSALARWLFGPLLMKDLETFRTDWNNHRIAKSRNSRGPWGKPNDMFALPEAFGATSFGKRIDAALAADALADAENPPLVDADTSRVFAHVFQRLCPDVVVTHSNCKQVFTQLARSYDESCGV